MNGIEEPRVAAMVEDVLPYAVTAAVKALVGHRRNDPVAWSRMRAPLRSLGEAECRKIFAAIDAIRASALPRNCRSRSTGPRASCSLTIRASWMLAVPDDA